MKTLIDFCNALGLSWSDISLFVSLLAFLSAYHARKNSERDRVFQLRERLIDHGKSIELAYSRVLSELYRRKKRLGAKDISQERREIILKSYSDWKDACSPMYDNAKESCRMYIDNIMKYDRKDLEKTVLRLQAVDMEMQSTTEEMNLKLDLLESFS